MDVETPRIDRSSRSEPRHCESAESVRASLSMITAGDSSPVSNGRCASFFIVRSNRAREPWPACGRCLSGQATPRGRVVGVQVSERASRHARRRQRERPRAVKVASTRLALVGATSPSVRRSSDGPRASARVADPQLPSAPGVHDHARLDAELRGGDIDGHERSAPGPFRASRSAAATSGSRSTVAISDAMGLLTPALPAQRTATGVGRGWHAQASQWRGLARRCRDGSESTTSCWWLGGRRPRSGASRPHRGDMRPTRGAPWRFTSAATRE